MFSGKTEQITSLQNPKIKDLAALQGRSDLRRKKGLFTVEGRREIARCIEGGYLLTSLFYCARMTDPSEIGAILQSAALAPDFRIFEVSEAVYEKIAYRGSTEGLLCVAETGRKMQLDDLQLPESPLIIVLESVEKPGNLGAVLRTADAAGADAVLVCDPLTDLFNPNLIRSSLGGIFTRNVVACTSEEAVRWLKKKGIKIFTAQLQDSVYYYDADMKGPSALVFGTESTGLSEIWRTASDRKILIPMRGKIDSLNVSVSVAVLCYEALRQRR